MTLRAVKTLQPFEFRSDFGPQPDAPEPTALPEPEVETIALTGPELAELLSEARAEGLAEARSQYAAEDKERLGAVAGKLNEALANLVALAGHLETAARDEAEIEQSLHLINAAARRIIDGQGDLFSEAAAAGGLPPAIADPDMGPNDDTIAG